MRLVCKKYRIYDVNLSGDNEVNFFANNEKQFMGEIDLKYYLLRNTLSDFEKTFESVNEVSKGFEIKMSNVNFQCKNEIYGRTSLQDFFELYTETPRLLFSFEYFDDENTKLFSGIIYKNNIEFGSRSNDILDITVVSEEKEFIDYFSGKDIIYPAGIHWISFETLFGLNESIDRRDVVFVTLEKLLEKNFPRVTIAECPQNYYVINKPFTYYPMDATYNFLETENLMHIRTGFDCFKEDQIKVIEYFTAMFQSKGWIWYFDLGKLYIKEKADVSLTSQAIDYRTEVLSHSVSSDLLDVEVDNVTVFNGNYFDSGSTNGCLHFTSSDGVRRYLGAEIRQVYTKEEHSNKVRPFVTLAYYPDTSRYRIDLHNLDYSFYNADTDVSLNRHRLSVTGINTANETVKGYNRERTLTIEPIINSQQNAGCVDLNNARAGSGAYYGGGNFLYAAITPITDSHLMFRGNPASSMIRFDDRSAKFVSYEVDCTLSQFANNMKRYVRSSNPIIFDVEVKGIISNAYQNITITNYPYADVGSKTFAIHRLSFNDITKTSKLTLQML